MLILASHIPDFYKTETMWGLPLGTVLFIFLIIRMLTDDGSARSRDRGFKGYWRTRQPRKPVDWKAHWAEEERKEKEWSEKWKREMEEWRKRK